MATGRKSANRSAAALTPTELGRIDPKAGSGRHRACAETTRVLLALTVTNLFLFESWCREAAPFVCGRAERADLLPPEVPRTPAEVVRAQRPRAQRPRAPPIRAPCPSPDRAW